MTDTLRNMPCYIRNSDAFGWQGADGPNGPWRSITPPQNGTPWQTTNPMDDLRQASADVSGVELEPGWRMTAAVPTKDEAVALYSEVMAVHNCQTLGDMAEHFARAVLARWGRQPAPPAAGEVGELVAWLGVVSEQFRLVDLGDEADQTDRAATLLAQLQVTPVPVSERLPGPEDCDGEGKVWAIAYLNAWMRVHHSMISRWKAWLPANALPLPQVAELEGVTSQ